jgi:hypothetical protein
MPTSIDMIFKNLCGDVSIKQQTRIFKTSPDLNSGNTNLRKRDIFLVSYDERFRSASEIYGPIVTNHLLNAP